MCADYLMICTSMKARERQRLHDWLHHGDAFNHAPADDQLGDKLAEDIADIRQMPDPDAYIEKQLVYYAAMAVNDNALNDPGLRPIIDKFWQRFGRLCYVMPDGSPMEIHIDPKYEGLPVNIQDAVNIMRANSAKKLSGGYRLREGVADRIYPLCAFQAWKKLPPKEQQNWTDFSANGGKR